MNGCGDQRIIKKALELIVKYFKRKYNISFLGTEGGWPVTLGFTSLDVFYLPLLAPSLCPYFIGKTTL